MVSSAGGISRKTKKTDGNCERGGDVAAVLRTDIGRVRRQNEDAGWFDENKAVFAVADGMGGHLAGEVASGIAIEAVKRMAETHEEPAISVLRDAVQAAHERILAHAKAQPGCAGMGTTLSMMWKGYRYVYIAHVGDSRIYRFRGERLEQITEDHSLVEELVRARLITREEARTHPRRNIITRALGTQGDNKPDLLAADVQPGDLWLLCTDGLHGMISDQRIAEIMRSTDDLNAMADNLMRAALDAGGRDNVTLVLWREEEE